MTNPHDVQLHEPLELITSTQALVPVPRQRELPPAIVRQYPEMKGYEWYERENEIALEPLLDALETAQELKWKAQLPVLVRQIYDLSKLDQDHYHKHLADELLRLVRDEFEELSYPGRYYHAPHDVAQLSQHLDFHEVVEDRVRYWGLLGEEHRTITYWRYQRVEEYGQNGEQIPPHAYKITQFIRKQHIQPHAWWVAVLLKEERGPSPKYRYHDPLLCVSFGRWVLAVAQWE